MHRRTHSTACCLFSLLLCGSLLHAQTPPAADPQAQALRNAAKTLAAKYDYAGANAQLNHAYALDKTSHVRDAATDLSLIGENEMSVGQYTGALDTLQQALQLRWQFRDRKGGARTLSRL